MSIYIVREYKEDSLCKSFSPALLFEQDFKSLSDAVEGIIERCPNIEICQKNEQPGSHYYSLYAKFDYADSELFFYKILS